MKCPDLSEKKVNAMIDAGIKARDLYDLANKDILTRADLRMFLMAALEVLHGTKGK